MRYRLLILLMMICLLNSAQAEQPVLKIGSKKFTESVILAEIIRQTAMTVQPNTKHLRELGGTRILWSALLKGDIDIYPEYTGTLIQEIFVSDTIGNISELEEKLNSLNIGMSQPLGFSNNYALGVKQETARRLHLQKISGLKKYPDLKFGFSNEFMDRADGWPGLQKFYNLPQQQVRGLDHDLAYRGLASGAIDVTELYTTDAAIEYYDLAVLEDDLHYFSDYQAVILYRLALREKTPALIRKILQLQGRISRRRMVEMNLAVKIKGISESTVASRFVSREFNQKPVVKAAGFRERLATRTLEHLFLVLISLSAAILLAIPLGILAYRSRKSGQFILAVVGIIQTIPSLALLVFMIPLFGIGAKPAIVALFLYSLLPIVRNTYSGLQDIPVPLHESAAALGLPQNARLRLIELPLASRSILAGIKTSAVINVGTATLGALIGAGGYGQPILTGIRLDNIGLILEGAIPAALLALLVQGIFELSELFLVSRGLRLKEQGK
ncbi:MAG: glycine betaine ABC transporter substrate-binding protein [Calditrichia bacterium]